VLFKIEEGGLDTVFVFEVNGGVLVVEFEELEGDLFNLVF